MVPQVSILICAYNAGSFLNEAVDSALGQTYPNFEVVLVDDGSTDGSVELLQQRLAAEGRLKIVRQPNRGKSAALNCGITHCSGQFIALQDADDRSRPERIECQVKAFDEMPGLAIVFCDHYLLVEGVPIAPVNLPLNAEECHSRVRNFEMPGLDPTMIVRRGVFDQYSFDESLPIVEGFDFILRVGECHSIVNIGRCLYGYRIHFASITKRDPFRRVQMFVKLMKKTCLRRKIAFAQRFPALQSQDSLERLSSPLNDTLSHCVVSTKSSVLSGRRCDAMSLTLWMMSHWPWTKETLKALSFSLAPKMLIRHYIRLQSSRAAVRRDWIETEQA